MYSSLFFSILKIKYLPIPIGRQTTNRAKR